MMSVMLIIAFAELCWMIMIIISYGSGAIDVAVFISRATLEDIIRVKMHLLNFFCALQLASIFSIGGRP